jgi:hypothetical protein
MTAHVAGEVQSPLAKVVPGRQSWCRVDEDIE